MCSAHSSKRLLMTTHTRTPSTCKVRREWLGGKRASGKTGQRRASRRHPSRTTTACTGGRLTGCAGLLAFGDFLSTEGVDRWAAEAFGRLKSSPNQVYSMGFQVRLLVDLLAAGETRPFGLEARASDPMFQHQCHGRLPSVDTVYDDLGRFDALALVTLEDAVVEQGLKGLAQLRSDVVHLDIDSSVLPLAGEHEGGVPGPNPKFHGRPSFHPLVARIAETNMVVGGLLRPGDRAFGEGDAATVGAWVARVKKHLRKGARLCVRIDAAADCAAILKAIHEAGAFYVIKARCTADVIGSFWSAAWETTDRDGHGAPTREVAELDFRRKSWDDNGLDRVRVIAVQSRDRQGKQLALFGDDLHTAQVFLTNRFDEDADDVAWDYDQRAGIEPLIAELKNAWGIGDATGYAFAANHALFLLKLLTYNLLRRFAAHHAPRLRRCRTAWLRRALITVPGQLVTSGRRHRLLVPRHALRSPS